MALTIVMATRNAGKAAELGGALQRLDARVLTLDDVGLAPTAAEDAIEVHDTFEANALAKARYYAALLPGHALLADDSGLIVDALGGAPGVRSRRWSGMRGSDPEVAEANNAKLLHELSTRVDRRARFVCALALAAEGRTEAVVTGTVEGRIAHAPRGRHGFGYDPLFEAEPLGWRTFGEATAAEKAGVSHRGRAVRALAAHLSEVTGTDVVRRPGRRSG